MSSLLPPWCATTIIAVMLLLCQSTMVMSFSPTTASMILPHQAQQAQQRRVNEFKLCATVESSSSTTESKEEDDEDDDPNMRPYQGEQPTDALSEIFIPNIFAPAMMPGQEAATSGATTSIPDDDILWVPQSDTVSFRPLCFCTSSGYYVNLLKVKGIQKGKMGFLSRHRHPGPVHGYVIKGSWKYLEHDWIAKPGSYIFEPPGEIHTLVTVPSSDSETEADDADDDDEMITLFHVTGSLLYCDEVGNVVGAEDVFTKLEKAKEYYKSIGLGEEYVNQFVR